MLVDGFGFIKSYSVIDGVQYNLNQCYIIGEGATLYCETNCTDNSMISNNYLMS